MVLLSRLVTDSETEALFTLMTMSLTLSIAPPLSISPPPYHSPSTSLPPFIAPSVSLGPHLHFPNITKVKHCLVSFTFTPLAGGFLKLAGNGKGKSENIHFVGSF